LADLGGLRPAEQGDDVEHYRCAPSAGELQAKTEQ